MLGIILPKEILQKLNVGEGDRIFVSETAYDPRLTTYELEFKRVIEAYRDLRSLYKNALRKLAK